MIIGSCGYGEINPLFNLIIREKTLIKLLYMLRIQMK